MCCIYASIDFPFPSKEEGGNGGGIYAHENGCGTYLLIKSGPQSLSLLILVKKPQKYILSSNKNQTIDK